ncbi:MAG: hydrogenase/urease maturation nickel metallochaperone HypA [Candidatus Hodarchaeales archaeon]|jgi:Zn finger protein HypA/HybF involved in hydrogenase expression
MHEIALAKSVQETVISVAMKNNGTSIKKIILKFGLFALIQEDQFRFCFDIIKKDSNLTI